MDIPVLARGLILGFSIAAVVGPIALLCLRRTWRVVSPSASPRAC
jgi:hypothetical protein